MPAATQSTAAPKSATLTAIPEDGEEGPEDALNLAEPPQIYSLQFIKEWKALSKPEDDDEDATLARSVFLLTSADDFVILWELDGTSNKKTKSDDGLPLRQIQCREIFSLQFSEMNATGFGVSPCNVSEGRVNLLGRGSMDLTTEAFGGIRNPGNLIYVFDASYCATNGLVGAALSDGSLRLMNGRGVCLSVLSLPGCRNHTHLTSFSWDSTGQRLVTTVATGHVIVWSIEQLPDETIVRSCQAIYQGGHIPGRPVFGARYIDDDELLITWGSDGRLCLWDGKVAEEVDAPLCMLLDNEDYPIYGVDLSTTTKNDSKSVTLTIAGGGAIGGFLGVPVFLQDITSGICLTCPPQQEAQA
jgi:WD40 repeat protein